MKFEQTTTAHMEASSGNARQLGNKLPYVNTGKFLACVGA